jgi:hypothetical protein
MGQRADTNVAQRRRKVYRRELLRWAKKKRLLRRRTGLFKIRAYSAEISPAENPELYKQYARYARNVAESDIR